MYKIVACSFSTQVALRRVNDAEAVELNPSLKVLLNVAKLGIRRLEGDLLPTFFSVSVIKKNPYYVDDSGAVPRIYGVTDRIKDNGLNTLEFGTELFSGDSVAIKRTQVDYHSEWDLMGEANVLRLLAREGFRNAPKLYHQFAFEGYDILLMERIQSLHFGPSYLPNANGFMKYVTAQSKRHRDHAPIARQLILNLYSRAYSILLALHELGVGFLDFHSENLIQRDPNHHEHDLVFVDFEVSGTQSTTYRIYGHPSCISTSLRFSRQHRQADVQVVDKETFALDMFCIVTGRENARSKRSNTPTTDRWHLEKQFTDTQLSPLFSRSDDEPQIRMALKQLYQIEPGDPVATLSQWEMSREQRVRDMQRLGMF